MYQVVFKALYTYLFTNPHTTRNRMSTNLPKVTQVLSNKVRIQIQAVYTPKIPGSTASISNGLSTA